MLGADLLHLIPCSIIVNYIQAFHSIIGNILLPPFGYGELYESARDVRTTLANQHKFVCELSQHILYQYCLFVLWMAIFIGIVVTAVELAHSILNQAIVTFGYR